MSLREPFRNPGKPQDACGSISGAPEKLKTPAGAFPETRKSSRRLRERFRNVGKPQDACGNLSGTPEKPRTAAAGALPTVRGSLNGLILIMLHKKGCLVLRQPFASIEFILWT